ncbi:hypothetical protein CEB3_c05380 [Peptococcaceae bacterium CEB3]|nr:hypothetical protein CEB3_c05380 [Peptococcaceae bacterium CEB3]
MANCMHPILWWPKPSRELGEKEERRVLSQKHSWESCNFALAKARGLVQTLALAKHLGVSTSWVRQHFCYEEWHHAYKKYGDGGKAHFYDPGTILETLRNVPELQKRIRRMAEKKHPKILSDASVLTGWERALAEIGAEARCEEIQEDEIQ